MSWLSRSHTDPKIINKYERIDIAVEIHKILKARPHLKWFQDKDQQWYIVHERHISSNSNHSEIMLPIHGKHIFVNEADVTMVRKTKNNDNDMNHRILTELINTIDILYRSIYNDQKRKTINNLQTHSPQQLEQKQQKPGQVILKKKYRLKIAQYEQEINTLKTKFRSEQLQLIEKNNALRTDYNNLKIKYNEIIHNTFTTSTATDDTDVKMYIERLKIEINDLQQDICSCMKEKNELKKLVNMHQSKTAQLQAELKMNAHISKKETINNDSPHSGNTETQHKKHKVVRKNESVNLQLKSVGFDGIQSGNIEEEFSFHMNLIKQNIAYYKEKKKSKGKKRMDKKRENKNGDTIEIVDKESYVICDSIE